MNRLLLPIGVIVIMGTAVGAADVKSGNTRPVLEALRAEIAAKPSRVLMAVEDALTVNEQAACEIVKEAIEATRADAKLVGEIVFTALQRAPAMAATIVECAVAISPGSVEQIQDAMHRALGNNAVAAAGEAAGGGEEAPLDELVAPDSATGKETRSKAEAPTAPPSAEDDDSFGVFGIGVGGIYLSVPGSSWLQPCDSGDFCCPGALTPACLRP